MFLMDNIMTNIKYLIVKKRVRYNSLIAFTGYSRSHISSVLNGAKICTPQFGKLLCLALRDLLAQDEETKTILETLWKISSSAHPS